MINVNHSHPALVHPLVTEDDYLSIALPIAYDAASMIKEAYDSTTSISYDSKQTKNDIVSNIELKVNEYVSKKLRQTFPNHALFTEEGIQELGNEYIWFLDPIDGSTNFIHKHPDFALSLGLSYRGESILGIIIHPYTMDIYYAKQNKGAWLNAKPISCNAESTLETALVSTEFSFLNRSEQDMEKFWGTFKHLYTTSHNVLISGSTVLELAYVSAGKLDVYIHSFDLLSPWDIAAGLILIKEAGGFTYDKAFKAFLSPTSSKSIFVFGNKKLFSSLSSSL